MLNNVIIWSLENRFIVILFTLVLAGVGIQSLLKLPIDAFPDTTPIIIQINTVAPSLSPEEIEQQITFPVEQVISGLQGLSEVRSISKFGLSQVTVIFEDGIDIYFARQLVMERLQTVELADGINTPAMGPVATGLGEIYHYLITGKGKTLQELTTIHDWIIKPILRSVPGVAEVNTWGGKRKQYHVLIDPLKLIKYELTVDDIFQALKKNNKNVGGGNITQAGEVHLIQGVGITKNIDEIENIMIKANNGVPIKIKHIGKVQEEHELRRAAVTADGKGEVVLGLGFMLMGENSYKVTNELWLRTEEIQKILPRGVQIEPVYKRTELVSQVIDTVKENLSEGAILVIAVLFLFLGNFRAGLIVALIIPLSMLFASSAMLRFGIAGSLMSLGAIDFGLVVDSSVIMVENSIRHLSEDQKSKPLIEIVRDASIEVRRPTMFGELIITIVYFPILTLEGVEGKLFRPMALTVIFALLGSLLLSLTLMPALASLCLPKKIKHKENFLIRSLKYLYRPIVKLVLRTKTLVLCLTLALVSGGFILSSRLGSEFIPKLSEMAIVINTVRLSGVSLEESVRYGTALEKRIKKKFPDEIKHIWTRTGTPEVATDPMGLELSDCFITLTPRKEWRRAKTQEELVQLMSEELEGMPGTRLLFTQPIEMRVNEMVAGIRSDLGIKIFGDDLEILKEKAKEVEGVLKSISGTADHYTEQVTGQPLLQIKINQESIARYGVSAAHVLEIIETIGGEKVGEIREDQKRFDLVVRLDAKYREEPDALRKILIPTTKGERIPLTRLVKINQTEGPSTITREWQKRRIVVQCNIRGRDIESVVQEVKKRLEQEVSLPLGYHITYGGQFEHLERAKTRLMIIVPLALFLIFLLLYFSTNSIQNAFIIFMGAPFASVGGIVALWLCGMPFTISAAVGFIAVSGVSMLNGLVMVSTIKQLLLKKVPLAQAIEESALTRLRPILMTALVAGLGFVPMALNTGIGAEVQRPLATVVIGGVISDNVLTLLVLPALYATFGKKTFALTDSSV
jgi:cobalt-zinc-cadmium resistance protein CzcA